MNHLARPLSKADFLMEPAALPPKQFLNLELDKAVRSRL